MMILTALAVALAPILEKAREQDNRSLCQSNLRQCAIAMKLYWNDWDASLPSSKVVNGAGVKNGVCMNVALRTAIRL